METLLFSQAIVYDFNGNISLCRNCEKINACSEDMQLSSALRQSKYMVLSSLTLANYSKILDMLL